MLGHMRQWANRNIGGLFLAPSFLIIILICAFPLIYSIYMSFFSWELASPLPKRFIGVENYLNIFQDSRFWFSLLRSIYIVGIGAILQMVLGFSLGILLNREFKGRNILTSFFLIPVVISPVVIAFMWKMIYSEQYGPLNYILNVVFYLKSVPWLSNTSVALLSIVIANSWEWFPLILLVTMGGLQNIPDDYIHAAQIDGASGWQITRWIIIPLLAPVLLTITLIRVIEDFKLFDLIYVLTHGGPGMSTETLNYLTYLKGFKFFSFGYSSALSILQMIVVIGIAALLVKKILIKD